MFNYLAFLHGGIQGAGSSPLSDGKDLAEQLKNGQPEIAHQTLQKMITQLNSANLTPEQLQKMLDEVSKAVDPANNYGKVADHLKSATSQMKGNNKSLRR